MRPESTAGHLLREARRRAGLSQMELGARAGVAQSVISAYESGHRQPAVPTLAALIEATGHELVLSLGPEPQRLARLSGPVGRRVRRNRHKLVAAAAAHGITGLRVFGSVARGDDRPDSDVDLLADLPPGLGLFGLGRIEAELEDIVSARVDLAPAESLKPQIRKRVDQELVPLWRIAIGNADIEAAIEAIRSHLERGGLSDGLVFDAVRIRLLEIGEAVKALPDDLLKTQPSIPWRQIARMRDHLAHR